MAIHVEFNFLKIIGGRVAKKRKRVPQARSPQKETIIIDITVTYSYFSNKMVRPNSQSITTL